MTHSMTAVNVTETGQASVCVRVVYRASLQCTPDIGDSTSEKKNRVNTRTAATSATGIAA